MVVVTETARHHRIASLKTELEETRERMNRRDSIIHELRNLGVGPTELAKLSGLTRAGVYDVLKRKET